MRQMVMAVAVVLAPTFARADAKHACTDPHVHKETNYCDAETYKAAHAPPNVAPKTGMGTIK